MLQYLVVAVLLAGTWAEERVIPEECKPEYFSHYDELGCTPVFGDGPCPIKYNCSSLESRSRDKCYVGGEEYEINSPIGSFYRGCSASCSCTQGHDGAKVTCAQVECPEMFNPAYRRVGCILQYTIDDCCSSSQFCPNATKNTTDITCEYNGSIYLQGQVFYPIEASCKKCVCQEGFDGTIKEPWCKKIFCGTELHADDRIRNGCTPIYYVGGCCPLDFRCPEDGDQARIVAPEESAETRTSAEKCTHGSLQMNVGEKLAQEDSCVECTCLVPPMITCVRKCNSENI